MIFTFTCFVHTHFLQNSYSSEIKWPYALLLFGSVCLYNVNSTTFTSSLVELSIVSAPGPVRSGPVRAGLDNPSSYTIMISAPPMFRVADDVQTHRSTAPLFLDLRRCQSLVTMISAVLNQSSSRNIICEFLHRVPNLYFFITLRD